MPEKNEHSIRTALLRIVGGDAVLVRHGDRTYRVPAAFEVELAEKDGHPAIRAWIVVDDGRARFQALHIVASTPLTPLELQRMPWAQLLDEALASRVVEVWPVGEGDWRVGRASRATATEAVRRSKRPKAEPEPAERRGRRPVTEETLRDVLRYKAEAQAQDPPVRWDTYAAKRMNLSPAYVRQLGVRATKELTDGER